MEVVRIAQIVPIGIDLGASARSPDRFEPAMIPVTDGKKIPIMINEVDVKSATTQSNFL